MNTLNFGKLTNVSREKFLHCQGVGIVLLNNSFTKNSTINFDYDSNNYPLTPLIPIFHKFASGIKLNIEGYENSSNTTFVDSSEIKILILKSKNELFNAEFLKEKTFIEFYIDTSDDFILNSFINTDNLKINLFPETDYNKLCYKVSNYNKLKFLDTEYVSFMNKIVENVGLLNFDYSGYHVYFKNITYDSLENFNFLIHF